MAGSRDRFPTGLRFLDQRLGGGLVPGGLLALVAPPDSQVELLFRELAGERPLAYVSLLSTDERELRDRVDPTGDGAKDLSVAYRDPSSVLSDPEAFVADLPKNAYVVLDSVDWLEEASTETYLAFLNALKERMRETGALAVLHCLKRDRDPENRALTLKRVDHVWDLAVSVESTEIKTALRITKSRANQILPEPLPLELGETVRIDTSRSIA